jgi:hypothetical protein
LAAEIFAVLMDRFTHRYIRLTLRIENHFIGVSVIRGARLAVGPAPEPMGFEHNVEEIHEEDEKENPN